ncbi:tetraacyldisaccharide 4'-kinase [Flavobacterium sp. U410]|jgi:tetraacyldisaccharide 4'-kinase
MNLLRKFLFPLGLIYWLTTYCRNIFYDKGWFKSYSFSLPIIAVGNLSVGGTGKTPHIEYLIRLLENIKVATLSRGYGRKTKGFILADEKATALSIGDEPFQFFSKFKDITVAVDADRRHGIEELQEKIHPEIILLDDAFQHRKVKAGFYILLTDYNHLFTQDYILPFGNLREPSFGKKRANVIIVTKCPDDISEIAMQNIRKELNVDVPVFFSKIVYDTFLWNNNQKIKIEEVQESKLIVAGIANPTSFINFLKKDTDDVLLFPDHHSFSEKDIETILATAKGRKIVTTEKDYMRLQDKIGANQLWYLPITIEIIENQDQFDKLIHDYVG